VAHFERNACGDAHLSGPSLNEYVIATSLIDGFSIVLKGVFVGCGRITADPEVVPILGMGRLGDHPGMKSVLLRVSQGLWGAAKTGESADWAEEKGLRRH
jgi:hypothetical protein